MRLHLPLLLLCAALPAAAALQIVRPVISQSEDGAPDVPGFQHVGGETLFFTCRISGFTKGDDQKIHLAFSVQAFDSKGVPLEQIYKNEISDRLTPQDKDWMPKIATEVIIPWFAQSGAYKIVVKVDDLLAAASVEASAPFQVRGHDVAPSDALTIRNFGFYRSADAPQAVVTPVFHSSDGVFAKFDIAGFQHGESNRLDVSYTISVIGPDGNVMWTAPPAADQDASFYPRTYVPVSGGFTLGNKMRPGEYAMAVEVKDAVGGQTYDTKEPFTVE